MAPTKNKNADEKSDLTEAQSAALNEQVRAGVESPDVSKVVDQETTDKVVEAFFSGNPMPGYGVRFVTRGGEAVPVVRKLG